MNASGRMRKVNGMLHEVIASEVVELKDPRLGFVTISGVDTAPDLRTAVVYFSVLGGADELKETAAGLAAAAPRLQARIGSRVRLKYLPRLRFVADESIRRGARIDEILRDVKGDGPGG